MDISSDQIDLNFDFYFNWAKEDFRIKDLQNQINLLKNQLCFSDYKIIKCYESQLLGEEMPYDYISLIQERRLIREMINELTQPSVSE